MKRTAFSLVELSIVLVILGLLVGGILAGQSLIRASELRSVSGDYTKYQTAMMAFRDKYFALPGDMANATSFWPSGSGNGNGNGVFDNNPNEPMKLWNHLALAGLVEGNYSGTALYSDAILLGKDVPASKISGAGYSVRTASVQGPFTANFMDFGRPRSGGLFQMTSAALSMEECWNIDTKMDDGVPFSGKLRGFGDTDTPLYSPYALNMTGITCALKYQMPN